MKCPRDGSTLATQNYEGDVYVDICPSCKGIWLDRGALEKIQESHEHDYSGELARVPDLISGAYDATRQKDLKDICCPKCGTLTESREYAYTSQVIINKCPGCGGIWLDSGELKALEIFYERSRGRTRK